MTNWLQGAVDIHVHASPSIYPRLFDADQLVAQAQAAGMRGVLLKAHEGSTVEVAALAQKRVTGLQVRGGIVLNHFAGGFNPYAVEMCLAQGGQMVWMPTVHAANHVRHFGFAGFPHQTELVRKWAVPPLSVLDARGRLLNSVQQVLEVMAGRTAALSAGHLSAPEIAALFKVAQAHKIARLVLTHAELPLMRCSFDFQKEMAARGVFIERSFLPTLRVGSPGFDATNSFPVEQTAHEVLALGPERVVLETDLGQRSNMPPTEGLERYCQRLHELNVPEDAIRRMAGSNPAYLLNLPPA
jgi:hypothetical protein